jgi:hypothetical protein
MGYDHSLTAHISFKAGVTTDVFLLALEPLTTSNDWNPEGILSDDLPGEDIVAIEFIDGYVSKVELRTAGEVPHNFIDTVQEFADGLELLAQAGYIDLRNHDTGDLDISISKIWYGLPYDIESAKKMHACDQAANLLAAAGLPDVVVNAVRALVEGFDLEYSGIHSGHSRIAIPENVQSALARMCMPLDVSRLSGATEADARSMSVIKRFIDQIDVGVGQKSGPLSAAKFWNELLMETESLTAIADIQGAATLADCMYLQNAITNDSYIDYDPAALQSSIIDLVGTLPSSAEWMQFIRVGQAGS